MKKRLAAGVLAVAALIGGVALGISETASATDSTVTFYRSFTDVSVSPDTWGGGIAQCDSGDSATGGGYGLNNWVLGSQVDNAEPVVAGSDTNPSEYFVEAYNADPTNTRDIYIWAVCEHQS